MISAMYNHVIGPGPNSKIDMNIITPPILPIGHSIWKEIPIKALIKIIVIWHQSMILRLPNLARRAIPPNVVKKFTRPTIPVIVVALMELPPFGFEKTVLE